MRWLYQRSILYLSFWLAAEVMCESVWCSAETPTQVWRTWLKLRDHCSEATRVRLQASAETASEVWIPSNSGKLSLALRSMPMRAGVPLQLFIAPGMTGVFSRFSMADSPVTC